MTKIYLSASLLFLGAAAFAQQFSPNGLQGKQVHNSASLEMPKEHRNNSTPSKLTGNNACGEKFITISKFDSVPPTGWSQIKKSKNNVGETTPEWYLRTWLPQSTFTALDLPTTIHRGDSVTAPGVKDMVEVDEWIISPDIDIPADKKIRFVFTWSTSSYWNAKADPDAKNDYADVEIKVSVGGGATDTSVYDPSFFKEDDEAKVKAGGVPYPFTSWEYYTSTYDLSAYAGKKINLAIHGVSRPKGAVEFIISEIYLEEVPANDLKLTEARVYSGPQELGYTLIPLHQMAPISFQSKLTNRGQLAQPNTMLSAHVYKDTVSLFNKKSGGISLEPGIDSLLRVTETNVFDPIASGVDSMVVLTVYEEAVSDSTECLASDNLETLPLFFNDSIYARDYANFQGLDNSIPNWAGASGQAFRIGNMYEIFMAKNLPSVIIGISVDTEFKEQLVYAQVHKYNEGTTKFELFAQTKDYTLKANDVKNQLVTVEFETPLKVEKGDLLLVTAGHYGGPADGSEDVWFMTSGDGIEGEILGFVAGEDDAYYLTDPPIPVVRLNFGAPDVSVAEEKAFGVTLKDLYPSPANEIGFIGYEVNKATTVKFRIFEASGKIVKEWNEGLKNNGKYTSEVNLNNLNPGLYFYSLVTERGIITKRFSLIK